MADLFGHMSSQYANRLADILAVKIFHSSPKFPNTQRHILELISLCLSLSQIVGRGRHEGWIIQCAAIVE